MSRLRVRHETGFQYLGDVTVSYNEARMLPVNGDAQFVMQANLSVTPLTSVQNYTDYWGTRVAAFEVLSPHRELTLTATSVVDVGVRARPAEETGWEELAVQAERSVRVVEQQAQTRLTAPPEEVAALAAEIAGRSASPAAAAREISTALGDAMEYVSGVTGVHSTAADAWRERKGVCQDITHLVLGALRSVGIPARYVSGYLHPVPDAEIGESVTGESHAWVEWFTGAWHGFDPTNLLEVGDRHVRIGHGRDYSDVPPLRGVYAGPSGSQLFVRVEITREA